MNQVFTTVNTIVSQWAFWTGLGSVVLFAVSRFRITLPDGDDLSPPVLARSFTTAFRFWLAACAYILAYATLYFSLIVIGSFPNLRDHLAELFVKSSGTDNPAVGTPAWAALVATAALPALPGIRVVDQWLRSSLQDFASIPGKARMLAEEMCLKLSTPEPRSVEIGTQLEEIVAAIAAHASRFKQLNGIWTGLQEIAASGAMRRYRKFQDASQKLMKSFQADMLTTINGVTSVEAALYIERRHRETVEMTSRLIACAMLEAEGSELTVRDRLREQFDVKVAQAGLNFRLSHLVLSLFVIAVTTVLGCYLAALLYLGVEHFILHEPTLTLFDILKKGTPVFFGWSISTVLLYALPITFAAGAAMYILDRVAANVPMNTSDYLTASVLTFLGSAVLALYVLLAYGLSTHLFEKMPWTDLLPWIIPPALVAATFVWLSTNPKNLQLKRSETKLYMFAHGLVAVVGSLLAFGLWYLVGGTFDPALANGLPFNVFIYFVVVDAAFIGASIGWVLSGTSQPFRIGNPIRKG